MLDLELDSLLLILVALLYWVWVLLCIVLKLSFLRIDRRSCRNSMCLLMIHMSFLIWGVVPWTWLALYSVNQCVKDPFELVVIVGLRTTTSLGIAVTIHIPAILVRASTTAALLMYLRIYQAVYLFLELQSFDSLLHRHTSSLLKLQTQFVIRLCHDLSLRIVVIGTIWLAALITLFYQFVDDLSERLSFGESTLSVYHQLFGHNLLQVLHVASLLVYQSLDHLIFDLIRNLMLRLFLALSSLCWVMMTCHSLGMMISTVRSLLGMSLLALLADYLRRLTSMMCTGQVPLRELNARLSINLSLRKWSGTT